MKTVYLDTSVILSPYHQGDPYQAESLSIIASEGLTRITSHIGLIELASAISRLRSRKEIQVPPEVESSLASLDFSKQVYSILLFMIKRGDIRIMVPDTVVNLQMGDIELSLSTMFVETFNMAPRTLLRTLDNLHLACLLTMLREGQSIHYMVTADEELLKARKKMTELTSVPVTSPRDLLNIEPL